MNFALINPKVWIEIAIVAAIGFAGWYAYNLIYDRGVDSIRAKWDAVEKERSDALAKASADALNLTKDLQATAEKERGVKDAQIAALNRNNAALLVELSKRPSRDGSGNLPRDPVTGAATGATGANLYRQDGEFLAREASRADKLRIDLIECQRRYNAAEAALK